MQKIYSFVKAAAVLAALLGPLSDATAGERVDDVKQDVIAHCAGDAYRLCPQSLTSVNDAAACMRRNRAALTPVCRVSFDRAVRVLAQK